jgi:RNA polymerase sigma factor (sigma-70 family)
MNREIEQSIDLQRAIADLPPRQYRVVSLWMQGYTQREIGKMMGMTQASVSRLFSISMKELSSDIYLCAD